MRIVAVLMLVGATCWAEAAFGIESLTVRIEPHAWGEVLTLDSISWDGQATTSGTILYLDGNPPGLPGPQDFGNPIVAASAQGDCRDPMQLQQG